MNKTKFGNRFSICWFVAQNNGYLSVFVLILASFLLFTGRNIFFNLNTELYGAFANNIRMMGLNLIVLEVSVWSYCYIKNNFFAIAILGFFQLILIISLKIYNQLNQININTGFELILIYTGLSHFVFGCFFYKSNPTLD